MVTDKTLFDGDVLENEEASCDSASEYGTNGSSKKENSSLKGCKSKNGELLSTDYESYESQNDPIFEENSPIDDPTDVRNGSYEDSTDAENSSYIDPTNSENSSYEDSTEEKINPTEFLSDAENDFFENFSEQDEATTVGAIRIPSFKEHLTSSVPRSARPPQGALTKGELAEIRSLFGSLDDAEIYRLYKRVTK